MASLREEFRQHGVVKLEGLFDAEALAQVRSCYDQTLTNPAYMSKKGTYKGAKYPRGKGTRWDGADYRHNDATGHRGAQPQFEELLAAHPSIARVLADIWGSRSVWYYDHEIFKKTDFERGQPTPMHQDPGVLAIRGLHACNIWIPFESTPSQYALQVVRGSHRGPLYTDRKQLPRMPDYQVWPDKEEQKKLWDVRSWQMRPGDAVMMHPLCIHGGGGLGRDFRERNSMVLRFYGDDCFLDPRFRVLGQKYSGAVAGDHFSLAVSHETNAHLNWRLKLLGPGLPSPAKL